MSEVAKKRLRIIISVKPGASHELYEDLAAVPVADRSERVRMLASLGVLAMRGRLAPTGAAAPVPETPAGEEVSVEPALLAGFNGDGWAGEDD